MTEQEITDIMAKLRDGEPMSLEELQVASAIGYFVGKVESHGENTVAEMAETLGIDISELTTEEAAIRIVAFNSHHPNA